MKKASFIFLGLFSTLLLHGQTANPGYDPVLAKKLGADERGMKMYVLVLLKSGPNNVRDSLERVRLFEGHFENITKLAENKKLIVAGPLEKNIQSYRGIFILDVPGIDEAKELMKGDPTIQAGIFDPEYYKWYGSAALPEYLDADKKLRKAIP